jgi:hypothetical protein
MILPLYTSRQRMPSLKALESSSREISLVVPIVWPICFVRIFSIQGIHVCLVLVDTRGAQKIRAIKIKSAHHQRGSSICLLSA